MTLRILDFDDMRAALHSLAPLRISEPDSPWPPLAPLVTQTLAAHTSARTNDSDHREPLIWPPPPVSASGFTPSRRPYGRFVAYSG